MNKTAGNAVSAKRSATNRSGGNVSRPTSIATKLMPHTRATVAASRLWRRGMGRRPDRNALALSHAKQWDEEVCERADPERVRDGSHADRAAEQPARGEHG